MASGKSAAEESPLERVRALFPPAKLTALAGYLRTRVASSLVYVPVDRGNERFSSFRGCKFVDFVVEHKGHGLSAITTREEAEALGQLMLQAGNPRLFARCEKTVDGKGKTLKFKDARVLRPVEGPSALVFDASEDQSSGGRYLWLYEGSTTWRSVQLVLLVAAVLAATMYQMWPMWARTIVWYLSVTLLLGIIGVIVLQLVLFVLVWPSGWSFWLLPNFTSDTAPIWELFTPVYTLEKSQSGSAWVRVSVVVGLLAGGWYLSTLPSSEFVEFMASQKKIVDDLYSGALLTDGSEGGDGSLTTGRAYNPYNPFGAKWGPGSGRYGAGRATHIQTLEEIEKMTQAEAEAAAEKEAAEKAAAEEARQEELHAQAGVGADGEADVEQLDDATAAEE